MADKKVKALVIHKRQYLMTAEGMKHVPQGTQVELTEKEIERLGPTRVQSLKAHAEVKLADAKAAREAAKAAEKKAAEDIKAAESDAK